MGVNSQVTISNLEIGVAYVLTATEIDESPDNWYYQTKFISRDNSDLELAIESIF